MKVLVACEESQTVCRAFRELGHESYSCDIQDCSGGHPEWHVMGNCLPLLNGDCSFTTNDGLQHSVKGEWDLLICHPPCTYMSKAGARWMYAGGVLNRERLSLAMEARDFFFKCYNAKCKHIAVENPVPLKIVNLPPPKLLRAAFPSWRALQQEDPALAQKSAAHHSYGHPGGLQALSAQQRRWQEERTEVFIRRFQKFQGVE